MGKMSEMREGERYRMIRKTGRERKGRGSRMQIDVVTHDAIVHESHTKLRE